MDHLSHVRAGVEEEHIIHPFVNLRAAAMRNYVRPPIFVSLHLATPPGYLSKLHPCDFPAHSCIGLSSVSRPLPPRAPRSTPHA